MTSKVSIKRKIANVLVLCCAVALLAACKISYTFTGMNISPEVKTYTVYNFYNRATIVNPTLSETFTNELKESLRKQTSLDEASQNGDIEFEGFITNYSEAPRSVQDGDQAALARLTISVKVKYTNNKDSDQNKEQTFSAFEDFDSTQSFESVEAEIVPLIVEKLIEDILNSTLSNW